MKLKYFVFFLQCKLLISKLLLIIFFVLDKFEFCSRSIKKHANLYYWGYVSVPYSEIPARILICDKGKKSCQGMRRRLLVG